MNGFVVRMIVALLLAVFLWAQSRATRGQPRRRRAFEMAAAALLAFAAYNGSLAAGMTIGPLQWVIVAVGLALFVGAVVSLVLSLSGGEMRSQADQVASAVREYREQRMRSHPPEADE